MPELPEVETVRRGLDAHVAGRVIDEVEVLHPRAVRRHVAGSGGLRGRAARPRPGRAAAPRQVPVAARRRRRAPGPPGHERPARWSASPTGRCRRTCGSGSPSAIGGPDLRFIDQRTFGHLLFSPGGARLPVGDRAYRPGSAGGRLRPGRLRRPAALAPQRHQAGAARPEPGQRGRATSTPTRRCGGPGCTGPGPPTGCAGRTSTGSSTPCRRSSPRRCSVGGTSFDSLYVNVNGESGYFDRSLAVYGRDGQPCPRCGTPVRRDPFMNRSAYTCPVCQPRPRNGRA